MLFFAAPALLMCIFVINKHKPPPADISPKRHPGKERMLAALKNENLDESITKLIFDREQYSFPFVGKLSVDGQQNLEQMLSTRRMVKVLQEIESLSKNEGKAKCELLFLRAFQQHTNACRIMINWSLDRVAPVTLCDEFPARRLCSATTNRSGDSHEIESVILIGY